MQAKVILLVALLFAVTSCAYSTALAKELAYYSEITHCSDSEIAQWSCSGFTSQVKGLSPVSFYNPGKNTFGFIAYNPTFQAVVVAFRGSEDIKNWITNLDTVRTSYGACSGCSVHLGFNAAYNNVSSEVRSRVKEYMAKFPGASLIVTGHSLGGALAVLCAVDLNNNVRAVDIVYTFGQPRVGNDKFAAYYQSILPQTYRLINYADTVVHSPPKLFGFVHHGVEVWYSPRGMSNYYICASESKTCANSISTISFSTSDHALLTYITLSVTQVNSLYELSSRYLFNLYHQMLNTIRMSVYTEAQIEQLEAKKVAESVLQQVISQWLQFQ